MKARILSFVVGAIVLIALCLAFDIGTVANYIQVASALPWFYVLWRVEELHRHHKRGEHK